MSPRWTSIRRRNGPTCWRIAGLGRLARRRDLPAPHLACFLGCDTNVGAGVSVETAVPSKGGRLRGREGSVDLVSRDLKRSWHVASTSLTRCIPTKARTYVSALSDTRVCLNQEFLTKCAVHQVALSIRRTRITFWGQSRRQRFCNEFPFLKDKSLRINLSVGRSHYASTYQSNISV